MYKFTKKHSAGLLMSLVVTLIIALPQLLSPYVIPNYQGFNAMETDSETHYWARVVSASQHGGSVGNPFIQDAHDDFLPTSLTAETLLGFPLRWFSFSIETWNVMYKLLLSFLLALAVYYFLLQLFNSRQYAAWGVPLVVIGSSLLIWFQEIPAVVIGSTSSGFLHFGRFVQPLFSGSLFFIWLALIVRFLKNDKPSFAQSAFIGAVTGTLAYLYIFYWLFALVCGGVVGIGTLIQKKWKHTRNLAIVLLFAILVDAWYLFDIFTRILTDDNVLEVAFISRTPQISNLLVVALIVTCIIYIALKRRSASLSAKSDMAAYQYLLFIFCVVASMWLVLNQQIITGRVLQPGHFYWYVAAPLTVALLLIAFYIIIPAGLYRRINQMIVLVIVTALGILIQFRAMHAEESKLIERQTLRGVFDWIAAKGSSDAVILADDEESNIIPVYLPNSVFYAYPVVVYPVNRERIEYAHFVWWWLAGLSVADIAAYIDARPTFIQSIHDPHNFRDKVRRMPDFVAREKQRLTELYEIFLSSDIVPQLRSYDVEYVLLNQTMQKVWESRGLFASSNVVYSDQWYTLVSLR